MKARLELQGKWLARLLIVPLALLATQAWAVVQGIEGTSFTLEAASTHIDTPEGGRLMIWGYAPSVGGQVQYPGPTLIVNEGDTVTVTLTNSLPDKNTSLVFPGQQVTASGGAPGLITAEAVPAGGTVSYTFTADHPGTYMYHSGTDMDMQIDMGLVGALIVRPAAGAKFGYNDPESSFDQEYLFLLTSMDARTHLYAEFGMYEQIDTTDFQPIYYFIIGRNGPDTLSPDNAPWMPAQPYGALARTHPGDKVLFRVVDAGRQQHPFHTHGNNFRQIARDGRLMRLNAADTVSNAGVSDYTLAVTAGGTYDSLWSWTGDKLGWDIFGTPEAGMPAHTCTDRGDGFDNATFEYCPDHNKPIPVTLPGLQDLSFGGFYSGSPFLGAYGALPPGEGGLNLNGGMFYMWHSHTEKELLNNDLPPGGMLSMMVVEPPGVNIP